MKNKMKGERRRHDGESGTSEEKKLSKKSKGGEEVEGEEDDIDISDENSDQNSD